MKRLIMMLIICGQIILAGANFEFAQELYKDGLYEEAIQEYQKVIDTNPTSLEAEKSLFQIGESYRLKQRWALAEEAYSRLLRAYPGSNEPDKYQFYLGLMLYNQQKYQAAGTALKSLLDNYPNSRYSREALVIYLQCYFFQDDFLNTILQGERLISNYSDSPNLPDLLLLIARASFADNNPEKGKNLLARISSEFPQSEARWQMLDLQMKLLEKEKGSSAVITELEKIARTNVPRTYEKELRQKLVNLYRNTGNHRLAMQELELMVEKFDNADDLDKIILLYTSTALELGQYSKVANSRKQFDKVFRQSELKAEYELEIARAHYYLGNYEAAEQIIEDILREKPQEKLYTSGRFLSGKIAEAQGRFREAIRLWQEILPYKPDNAARILINIGDIYSQKFSSYNTALNYYRQVLTSYSNPALQQEVVYKSSLCYESLGNEEEALMQLESIDLSEVADSNLQERISKKREYIKRYQLQDFEKGFHNLLSSLYAYLDDNNREVLQQHLAEILAGELKEFESAAKLLQAVSPETAYQKALLLLKLSEKYDFEQRFKDRDEVLLQVNSLIYNYQEGLPRPRSEELKIKKLLVASGKTPGLVSMLQNYIDEFPASEAANEFLLHLIEEYKTAQDTLQLVKAWQVLKNDKRIDDNLYFMEKINLAEYYYDIGDLPSAYDLYQLAAARITITQPEAWYHYARVEHSLENSAESLSRLQFLVDNVSGFDAWHDALGFLIVSFRQNGDTAEAIRYSQYMPQEQRNKDFYLALADDYMNIDDLENAKLSLMYIEDKDDPTLLKLADLQYRTGDLGMALYSYSLLADKGIKNPAVFLRIGDIHYNREEYQNAINRYKNYLENASQDDEGYLKVVSRYISSHYLIKNRPKAEELKKTYKNVITETAEQDISLAEAIYYTDIDVKKAEKIFNKLLKENPAADTMIKTYFWRGLLYLKQQNLSKAKEDFNTVANATNENLANQAKFKLGLINFSEENFQESLKNYYYVIENDDDGKLALEAAQNFAHVCKTIEEWDKAIAAYEIILQKWGDGSLKGHTIFDIAFCYYRDKNYLKAVEIFRQAVNLIAEPELQAEAQYWIGMSFFGLDDFEQAVTELLKVSYSYDTYTQWAASAELQAGEAYQRIRSDAKARRIYERIIEKYGAASQWGELARQRLNTM
jgi:tetratricopeptide (TPR) repeat protein